MCDDFNLSRPSDAYISQQSRSSLVPIMASPLRTNLSDNSIKIWSLLFNEVYWKMSYAKQRPFCLGFNYLFMICSCTFMVNFVFNYACDNSIGIGHMILNQSKYQLPKCIDMVINCLNQVHGNSGDGQVSSKKFWTHNCWHQWTKYV